MMTIVEFNLLTFEQKCSLIERKGVYLAGRNEDNFGYNLYAVYSFYVELRFNFSDDYLEHLQVFTSPFYLEPYLQEIELDLYF